MEEEGAVVRINRILERTVLSRLQRFFCCFIVCKVNILF